MVSAFWTTLKSISVVFNKFREVLNLTNISRINVLKAQYACGEIGTSRRRIHVQKRTDALKIAKMRKIHFVASVGNILRVTVDINSS